MHRKMFFGTLLLLIGASSLVFGQADDATASTLEDAGYRVVESRTESGLPTWDVVDDQGRPFSISLIGSLSQARVRAIGELRSVIYALDGLTIQRLRIVFDRDRANAVVIPSEFVIEGDDYVAYMPSGMQFLFQDGVAYDFRMLIDNLAVRINGQFFTNEQFFERIVRAVDNPAAYILSQDPQFLAVRLDEQQSLIDDLQGQLNLEVSRNADAMADLENRLIAEVVALTEQFETMRQGAVVLASRGAFGGISEVDPETVVRVVELRIAEPNLPASEALSRVNDELPSDAARLSRRHVQAIYAFYFNDYE